MRTSDPTISSKGTSSPGSRDRISWTRAIDLHPALGLAQGLLPLSGLEAAGLEPEQRRDRLQVVLHTVMHLADGRVLGEQEAVEAAKVGDVAQQHHGPRDRVLLEQGRALHEDDDVGPALDLLGDRTPRPQRGVAPRCRRSPAPTGVGPRRRRSRPCGAMRSWRWERRSARSPPGSTRTRPSPTRGASSVVKSSPTNGKSPTTTMCGEPSVQVAIDTLEASGAAVLERRHPHDDGDGLATVAHRDALELRRLGHGRHLAGVARRRDRSRPAGPGRGRGSRRGPTTPFPSAGPRSPPASRRSRPPGPPGPPAGASPTWSGGSVRARSIWAPAVPPPAPPGAGPRTTGPTAPPTTRAGAGGGRGWRRRARCRWRRARPGSS